MKNVSLNLLKENKIILIILICILMVAVMFPTDNNITKNTSESAASADTTESKLERILGNMEGVGEVNVMITYKGTDSRNSSDAEGAVVIAEGGGDPEVIAKISSALEAVLNLPAHKIQIFKMT